MLARQCAHIVHSGPLLEVVDAAITPLIQSIDPRWFAPPDWRGPHACHGPPEQVVSWLLAYNAVNFSYFRDDGRRYWTVIDGDPVGDDDEALAVMARFARLVEAGDLRDPDALKRVAPDDLDALLAPAPDAASLPMMRERAAGLRELGQAYERLGGPLQLLALSHGNAGRLVDTLVGELPSWEDTRRFGAEVLAFRKRAQLCVAMICACLERRSPAPTEGIGSLTVFSDYRLPQILRGSGVIRLGDDLAATIEAGQPIPEGSDEEIALRAATIHGGELMRQALTPQRPGITALEVDHALWRTAVEREAELPPFHRTRTTAY